MSSYHTSKDFNWFSPSLENERKFNKILQDKKNQEFIMPFIQYLDLLTK